jgi:hypothetical protein
MTGRGEASTAGPKSQSVPAPPTPRAARPFTACVTHASSSGRVRRAVVATYQRRGSRARASATQRPTSSQSVPCIPNSLPKHSSTNEGWLP